MQKLKYHFSNREFLHSFLIGLLFLVISLFLQFYASNYATRSVSGSVTDIVLSNTRVYDVDGIFIYGTIALIALVIYLCFTNPKYFLFILKSVAVFTTIRAFFITLTHINVYPLRVAIESNFFQETLFKGVFTGSGLFFSGHTGMPFLLALLFWNNKILRYVFLGFSIMMAFVVLLGHIHYSIDVFSAFFITYSIFHICIWLFPKDWALFRSE